MSPHVSIVIVTHNSGSVLSECLRCIEMQSVTAAQVIIIDSGSDDTRYLDDVSRKDNYLVRLTQNRGFAAGNNFGLNLIDKKTEFVLIVNPDTFIEKSFIENSIRILQGKPDVAVLTGMLRGYDLVAGRPSGKIDSTGIFRKWYGRWYDRGQGENVGVKYQDPQVVPAVCGALMFFRIEAILSQQPCLFDDSFFMYKEDIELCMRLKKSGWKMYYTPTLSAFHCRGWGENRKEIDRRAKLQSSANEIKLYLKHPSFYLFWAVIKYMAVRWFNL